MIPLQADLDIVVANVLDIWAKLDPNRIIVKQKLHVLTHLRDDVRRFGPPSLYEVEAFESSNKVFHQCSVLSNHHAPSHDIAMTMARMERFVEQDVIYQCSLYMYNMANTISRRAGLSLTLSS